MSEQLIDLPDTPEVLQSLPADKYGKAAFVELTYTPRKLKDNLLYVEAVTMKKEQEKNNKLRQISAENDFLQDRLDQLKRQKQGIEDSLSQQINMYKKFISQMQTKYELKTKNIQNQFKQQMRIVILEQEQTARVVQAEKQQYEQEIETLKKKIAQLEGKLGEANKYIQNLNQERNKLHVSQKQITFQLQQAKQLRKLQDNKTKQQYQKLQKKLFETQQNWKTQLHKKMLEKEREIDQVKRQSLQDLSKLEQKASGQNIMKNTQIQQITKTFNSQFERLNGQLGERQKAIESLQRELSQEKQKMLQTTRAYDRQINNLIFEKNRLASDVDALKCHNVRIIQRQKAMALHPIGLNIQVGKLKQLLLESHNQLESCKQQLVAMDKQRSKLLLKIRQLGQQNELLHRSRRW